mmetsp:Transcript_60023/g.123247  ORF Transcript_60023/g.123247 Transcript_60023/m.123247 type:complete len:378 (+) Transcript_60023:848-1981(+)
MTNVFTHLLSLIWILPLLKTLFNAAAAIAPPLPRTPTAALSIILILSSIFVLFQPITLQSLAPFSNTAFVMACLTANSTVTYLVDSACTTSIICDTRFLRNYQCIKPTSVAGFSRQKSYNWKAELHLPTTTDKGERITIIIPNCYWDADGYYNLLATDQLNYAGYTITLPADKSQSSLTYVHPHTNDITTIPRSKVGRLHDLPVHDRDLPYDAALVNTSNMSLEELFHLWMAHTPVTRLAQMSKQVTGVPRHLQFARALRFPCSTCQHAKAIRQTYPEASEHIRDEHDSVISWDLIDLGENFTTIRGNRYLSLFIIHCSRFAITILHNDRTDFKQTLQRAFAKDPVQCNHSTFLCTNAGFRVTKNVENLYWGNWKRQ